MKVSGVLITHHLSDEALGWFSRMRTIVDELVVFLDEARATPRLRERLGSIGARVHAIHGAAFYNFDFASMAAACQGDWILKVDYDEELSAPWFDLCWRDILRSTPYTHFWCPRRWITKQGYIACEPWWPDWQLRLFRNAPALISFPTQLHETMRVEGKGGYLRTLAIHHHELRLTSRVQRETKAASYESHRPGHGLGFFYLPENYDLLYAPIPADQPQLEREILQMEDLDGDALLAIEAEPPPSRVMRGDVFWVQTVLRNETAHAICTGAPSPINLAYHWIEQASGRAVVFDGVRTAILPQLAARTHGTFRMFVKAPDTPGDYVLRITSVQEGVRWLEWESPAAAQDFPVSVTAA